MKKYYTLLCLLALHYAAFAQVAPSSGLYRILKENDSLLFDVGYNTCDIRQFETLVSDSFEFYHDQAGVTTTKAAFIRGIRDGLCKLAYKPRRELVENSLQVYPLKKDGVLYGAIQIGTHRFYAIEKGKPEYLTSTAKFTAVWLLEKENWKLSRVLSYDHRESKEP